MNDEMIFAQFSYVSILFQTNVVCFNERFNEFSLIFYGKRGGKNA